MEIFLLVVVIVLSCIIFVLWSRLSKLEEESLGDSLVQTSLLRVLFYKKVIDRDDLINEEAQIKRVRTDFDQRDFEVVLDCKLDDVEDKISMKDLRDSL